MAGSADVEPTEERPHVAWGSIAHKVTGLAGSMVVAFTHSGAEGVYEQVAQDLEEAVRSVFAKHGFTL